MPSPCSEHAHSENRAKTVIFTFLPNTGLSHPLLALDNKVQPTLRSRAQSVMTSQSQMIVGSPRNCWRLWISDHHPGPDPELPCCPETEVYQPEPSAGLPDELGQPWTEPPAAGCPPERYAY